MSCPQCPLMNEHPAYNRKHDDKISILEKRDEFNHGLALIPLFSLLYKNVYNNLYHIFIVNEQSKSVLYFFLTTANLNIIVNNNS